MPRNRDKDNTREKSKYDKNPEHYREKSRKYRKANPEKVKDACRRWRAKYPEKQRLACVSWNERNRHRIRQRDIATAPRKTFLARVRKYGMNEAEMQEFLDTHHFCEICGAASEHVDHSHKTGKVRGMLCKNCNIMLGNAFDNPAILKNAILYLEERGQ